MKHLLHQVALIILCTFSTLSINAEVWTVSNDPLKPAQFTSVQTAINNANPGDTLRIAGSATNYGGFITYIPIVMIGEGANNPDGASTKLLGKFELRRLNSSIGSSGSKFYGINFLQSNGSNHDFRIYGYFGNGTIDQYVLSDILFERCVFSDLIYLNKYNYNNNYQGLLSNIVFRNCLFANGTFDFNTNNLASYSGIVFTNCVFSSNYGTKFNSSSSYKFNGSVVIRNCLFLNNSSNQFYDCDGFIVENSVFYKAEPSGATNSVFNNCITYLNNDNTLPYGNNAGSGNLESVNPNFLIYPALGATFSWAHDYGLQVGSPAIGTGTDGSDIGLTGGNSPFNNIPGYSAIPVVTNITLPSGSVPVGGTLEINVSAKTRN